MTRLRPLLPGVSLAASLALAAACESSPSDSELIIDGTGVVTGFVYVDVDGSGSRGAVDEPLEGLRVRLVPSGGGGVVTTATTDTLGIYRMTAVPVGGFRLEVDPATVPDSVEVLGLNPDPFILAANQTVVRDFRVSFPTFTLAEVRALDAGRRVFTHGIVLNARLPFGDGVVHLREGEVYLRGTNVARVTIAAGDSVRFSGRTEIDASQPVLTDGRVFLLQPQAVPPPVPIEMTNAVAANAADGTRDAAFARVRNAVIQDTVRVGDDLIVTTDDGSGPLDIVLRGFINWNWATFRPDSVQFTQVAGLIVPVQDDGGEVRWRLKPRGGGDVTLADVGFEDEEGAGGDSIASLTPAPARISPEGPSSAPFRHALAAYTRPGGHLRVHGHSHRRR